MVGTEHDVGLLSYNLVSAPSVHGFWDTEKTNLKIQVASLKHQIATAGEHEAGSR